MVICLALWIFSGCVSEKNVATEFNDSGLQHFNEEDYESAIKDFENALLTEENAVFYYNKGMALKNNGNEKEAIEAFEKATELDPELGEAYYNIGLIYIELNDLENAKINLEKAVDDSIELALPYIGHIYEKEGNYEKAIQFLKKYTDHQQEASIYNQIGLMKVELGNYELALDSFKQALEIENANREILFNIAIIYQYLNELEQAKDYLLVLLEHYPEDEKAQKELTFINYRMKE